MALVNKFKVEVIINKQPVLTEVIEASDKELKAFRSDLIENGVSIPQNDEVNLWHPFDHVDYLRITKVQVEVMPKTKSKE